MRLHASDFPVCSSRTVWCLGGRNHRTFGPDRHRLRWAGADVLLLLAPAIMWRSLVCYQGPPEWSAVSWDAAGRTEIIVGALKCGPQYRVHVEGFCFGSCLVTPTNNTSRVVRMCNIRLLYGWKKLAWSTISEPMRSAGLKCSETTHFLFTRLSRSHTMEAPAAWRSTKWRLVPDLSRHQRAPMCPEQAKPLRTETVQVDQWVWLRKTTSLSRSVTAYVK